MKSLCSLLVLVVAVTLASASDASACSCGGGGRCPGAAELWTGTRVAFVGTMVSDSVVPPIAVTGLGGSSGPGMRFRVTERLVGTVNDTEIVYNAPGSCRYNFKPGVEYLVFVDGGTMMIAPCAGIATAAEAASRVALLRAARDERSSPSLLGLVVGYPPTANASYLAMTEALSAGRPVAGRTVVASSQAGEYRAQTGANGLYAFNTLPPGRYAVSLDPPGLTVQGRSSNAYSADVGTEGACRVDFLSPLP